MSFILDALRKAEQQRNLGRAPTLATAPTAHAQSADRWPRLLILLAALVAMNLTVLLIWAPWQTAGDMATATTPTDTSTTVNERFAEPSERAVTHSPTPLTVEQPLPLAATTGGSSRQDLPELNLDVHVYSDVAERRFVLINGKRYRQGDWLNEGPVLELITADGVILQHDGQRLSINVER